MPSIPAMCTPSTPIRGGTIGPRRFCQESKLCFFLSFSGKVVYLGDVFKQSGRGEPQADEPPSCYGASAQWVKIKTPGEA